MAKDERLDMHPLQFNNILRNGMHSILRGGNQFSLFSQASLWWKAELQKLDAMCPSTVISTW